MIEPSCPTPFVEAKQQQKVENRNDLPDGLVFTKPVRRKYDSLGGCELTESCDQEFAADNDYGNPGRDCGVGFVVDGGEADQCGRGKNFVDQGIHQGTKICNEVAAAGDGAVKVVGEAGDAEEKQPQCAGKTPLHLQHSGQDNRHGEAQECELVGKVHGNRRVICGFAARAQHFRGRTIA